MKWLGLWIVLFACAPVSAHEVRPAYLELTESRSGVVDILWKTPMRGELRLALTPEFSAAAMDASVVATRHTGDAAVQTWRMASSEPLRGQSLWIAGLEGTMTDVLVRAEFADGGTWTQRLTPSSPTVTIPARTSGLTVAGVYLLLGVEHILHGLDHLLFVLTLLLITRGATMLIKTVTAFTVAHSITLGLSVLGVLYAPAPPVEAVIALSIAFVAAEIVRARRGQAGIAASAPWIVAFVFGLVHGLGFAGALNEIGLPQGQIPLALLFFNIGVELGQLLFIGAVLAALAASRRAGLQLSRGFELLPPYTIGGVAMFWMMQRISTF